MDCKKKFIVMEVKLALKESFLFAVGLIGVLQIVASVVRPVPAKAPTWYAYLISILDVIFLDTGGVINQECLDGDALSSERRVIGGALLCCVFACSRPPAGSWKPASNIRTVLSSIQLLMSEPNPDDALMADIVSAATR